MTKDLVLIKKHSYAKTKGLKTLKVSPELHARVWNLAMETNQLISDVACLLVAFALDHVKIVSEEGEDDNGI